MDTLIRKLVPSGWNNMTDEVLAIFLLRDLWGKNPMYSYLN